MVTAKHNFQKLVFNPLNQKLVDFLDELQKLAKDAFGIAAHAIIEQFKYAKMPAHLKGSIKQAHLRNCPYKQIATHLEPNVLEAPDQPQRKAVSQQATNTNADRSKPRCHHCKNQHITRISVAYWKNRKNKFKILKKTLEKNSGTNNSDPTNNINNIYHYNNHKKSNRAKRKLKTLYLPCELFGKTNYSTENCSFGANAASRTPHRNSRPEGQNPVQERANQSNSEKMIKLQPKT